MGPASASHNQGIREEKAELECSYKEADALYTDRTAIRQKVGRSSKYEYLILVWRI